MAINPPTPPKLLQNSRGLRREMTVPERLLWSNLRAGRLAGLKFRSQYPIDPYIADFYCHDYRLVIELDGDSHNDTSSYDRQRERFFQDRDLRILRVLNDEVIHELEAVLIAILTACGRLDA